MLFSSEVEKYIPPQKGKTHLLHIIRELIDFQPKNKGTDISEALKFLRNVQKRRSTAFLLSDFMCPDYEDALKIASKAHELIALQIHDPMEAQLPDWGLVRIHDNENGLEMMVDTSSAANRQAFARYQNRIRQERESLMSRYGIAHASISTQEDYVKPLINMFSKL